MTRSSFDFTGKTVLVTGAGRGIGTGIAEAYAEAGASVVVHYRSSREGAEAVAARISGRAFQADLRNRGEVEGLLEKAGRLDVLVNNAGIYPLKPLLEITDEDWAAMIDSNQSSVFLTTQLAAKRMIEQGVQGSIVNITSIEAHSPAMLHAHYNASKAAVDMFTRASALELGPHGIRVNAVAPGLIDYPELASLWPEGVVRWKETCPLSRLGHRRGRGPCLHVLIQ